MKLSKNSGVSMVVLVITIVLLIILSSIAIGGSMKMIDDSSSAKNSADAAEDNDKIRTLLTETIIDNNKREGISLESIIVIGSVDKEYGLGYYLIPGGDEDTMDKIIEKTGDTNLKKYKNLTAPYVVDYDNGRYERIEEIRFK